ncbi:MAG TPA: hypothetical protein VFU23_15030, partial [Gemmatimonadales bacterium]|nr:hypothetical protein [Gemmatimonadales bacterium]
MPSILRASLLGLLVATAASAQRPAGRADSAWAAGDRELARRLFLEDVTRDSTNSHAVYRLASLTGDRKQALELYLRYTRLEPDDAWGWMAAGNQLARLGKTAEALALYDHAARLRPTERDVTIGRARVLSRGGRPEAAAAEYERWTSAHLEDQEAWREEGREWLRAGRPRRAAHALEHVAPEDSASAGLLRRARGQAAPAVEPSFGYARDSDANRTTRFGLLADWQVGEAARLGLAGFASAIGDGAVSHRLQEGYLRLSARPAGTTRLTMSGGAARLDPGAAGSPWSTPAGEARLRWQAPLNGPQVEIRGQRLPLGSTPLLVENRAIRNEGRATVDLPVGPVRLRAGGRAASIEAPGQSNSRWSADGALVIPLGEAAELSAQYHRLHYARLSTVGFFAPDRVETI